MTERQPNDFPEPVGDGFAIEQSPDNGYIALPPGMQVRDSTKILSMWPGEWSFISNGSAQVDERSQRISLDTNDKKLAAPRNLNDLYSRPAVMRVLRGVGERALRVYDGYVMDFRWVRSLIYDDRGLDEGMGSTEFMQAQQDYQAVLPLGVIFTDSGKSMYVGHGEVRDEALQLAQWVDDVAKKLGAWPELPKADDRARLNEWPQVNE